jgi:Dyp-type peroxidase family
VTSTPLRPVAAPLVEMRPLPPLRKSTEIQGNVLAAFNKDFQTMKYLTFEDDAQARGWLAGMLGHLSFTSEVEEFNEVFSVARRAQDRDPAELSATWVCASLTYGGLLRLAADKDEKRKIEADLKPYTSLVAGAASRAGHLGDTGASDPKRWIFGGRKGRPVHAMVIVAADREADLQVKLSELAALDAGHKVTEAAPADEGRTLPGRLKGHEHFGYKDGISQPGVEGFHHPDPDNAGRREGHPGSELIKAGEFVFGYPVESTQGRPPVAAWMRDGSLQVMRRLRQDVAAWNQQIDDLHKKMSGNGYGKGGGGGDRNGYGNGSGGPGAPTRNEIGACLVGRFKNGQPLARPEDEVSGLGADRNSFTYEDDPWGSQTPCAAHIRKTNPRAFAGRSHRIMRRGIPYGRPYSQGESGTDRGLLFVCYNTSIEQQFEFIQRVWSNNPDFRGGDENAVTGVDPVSGPDARTQFAAALAGSFDVKRMISTTGAVYSLMLSRTTLTTLAAGRKLPHESETPSGG